VAVTSSAWSGGVVNFNRPDEPLQIRCVLQIAASAVGRIQADVSPTRERYNKDLSSELFDCKSAEVT
jgi:hypothetical protein